MKSFLSKYPTKHYYLNIFIGLMSAVYFTAMVAYPFWNHDWSHIQNIWDRWQGFNVGMLALLSSIIAFGITKYNTEQQRQRNFVSATAHLSFVINELDEYFKKCIRYIYNDPHAARLSPSEAEILRNAKNPLPEQSLPVLPDDYKHVFEKIITHANANVGNQLVLILDKLKAYDLRQNYDDRLGISLIPPQYAFRIAELYILTHQISDIGKNEENFKMVLPTINDFKKAYDALGISHSNDVRLSLINTTEAMIKRGSKIFTEATFL